MVMLLPKPAPSADNAIKRMEMDIATLRIQNEAQVARDDSFRKALNGQEKRFNDDKIIYTRDLERLRGADWQAGLSVNQTHSRIDSLQAEIKQAAEVRRVYTHDSLLNSFIFN